MLRVTSGTAMRPTTEPSRSGSGPAKPCSGVAAPTWRVRATIRPAISLLVPTRTARLAPKMWKLCTP